MRGLRNDEMNFVPLRQGRNIYALYIDNILY